MLFSQNLALGRADPTLVDVDFNNVSLLLGFENNLIDESPAKNTGTVTGTLTYDSSIKKWDTYSGSMASGANFLTFSNTGSFYFATGDFTIETWVYVPTGTWGTGNVNVMDIAQRKNGVQGGPSGFFLSTSSLTVSAFKTAFYDNTAIGFVSSTAVLPTNAWHHIVTGRRGTAIYLGTNGTLQNMGTSSKNWFPYSPRIHCDDYQEYGYAVKFDEFRVTKGVWRYGTGATYTVPTTRFPRQ